MKDTWNELKRTNVVTEEVDIFVKSLLLHIDCQTTELLRLRAYDAHTDNSGVIAAMQKTIDSLETELRKCKSLPRDFMRSIADEYLQTENIKLKQELAAIKAEHNTTSDVNLPNFVLRQQDEQRSPWGNSSK